ncbi:DUF1918 domain-containing protein [Streptomyces lavenduligriseus]|uniref:DUF1918 domain-containing protein n=1 Tax=Streptomyces lavenduligriseus TaxID=67315 RepID=A0ABT0P5P3_9ACTN|nr:DUF1918 domain-containing protein [Streptomyces lavenduligriseus]MCL3999062.1 DUF1918 domain-containing protein [Streptomyces lavenduligriseus]
MESQVGDRIHVHSTVVGQGDRQGEITEVRGPEGAPPYMVRFDDGQETLVYPGPNAVIEPQV